MSFGSKLKAQIKMKGYTMEYVGSLIGVGKGAISHWCNDIRSPSTDDIKRLSEILNVDVNIFFNDKINKVVKIKIRSEASCGSPISGVELDEEVYMDSESYNNEMYAVKAAGDSMMPEIHHGDRIVCDPSSNFLNGDLVHYIINNESAIKVYYKDDELGLIQFIPYNSSDEFKTTSFKLDSIEDLKIAKVIDIISSKRNNRLSRLKAVGR